MSSITTKAKYLGSIILPSPIEVEVTLSLYNDRVEIPELEAAIYLDKIDKIMALTGSELPPQTMVMAGVVGLVIEKTRQYVMIRTKPTGSDMIAGKNDTITSSEKPDSMEPAMDGILLRFEDDAIANQFVIEAKSSRNAYADVAA